jgi:hypothetical protein
MKIVEIGMSRRGRSDEMRMSTVSRLRGGRNES